VRGHHPAAPPGFPTSQTLRSPCAPGTGNNRRNRIGWGRTRGASGESLPRGSVCRRTSKAPSPGAAETRGRIPFALARCQSSSGKVPKRFASLQCFPHRRVEGRPSRPAEPAPGGQLPWPAVGRSLDAFGLILSSAIETSDQRGDHALHGCAPGLGNHPQDRPDRLFLTIDKVRHPLTAFGQRRCQTLPLDSGGHSFQCRSPRQPHLLVARVAAIRPAMAPGVRRLPPGSRDTLPSAWSGHARIAGLSGPVCLAVVVSWDAASAIGPNRRC